MAENFFGITDTGKTRNNNEDTFIAQPSADGRYIIAAVIDGVGGYSGGEVAAAIARDTLTEQLSDATVDVIPAMEKAFLDANDKIFHERTVDKKLDSMACVCTLVMADVQQNQLHYAHVGDTRLYLFRDGSLIKISSDHSFVGFLEDSGRLTEEAAMNHPKRNEINKALGFEPTIRSQQNYVETGSSPFLPGDLLLLCSDGLTDMVNKQDISDILLVNNSLKDKAKSLIDLANHNGGHDNITVVLVKNDKKPTQLDAVMPAPTAQKKKLTVNEQPDTPQQQKADVTEVTGEVQPKNHTGLITLLAILCLVFFASTAWLYLKGKPSQQVAVLPAKDSVSVAHPGADQQKLLQIISTLKGDTLVLSDSVFKAPILIATPIAVAKDTLYIKTKGNVTLKADSAFKGPAFALDAKCKLIVFERVAFNGFKTAITAYNNALILKTVKFDNCTTPVQVSFTVPDSKTVTGWLPAAVFKLDSIRKAPNK